MLALILLSGTLLGPCDPASSRTLRVVCPYLEALAHLDHAVTQIQPVPAQIAVLAAGMEQLAGENRALRTELAAVHRQIIQISWALVAALLGASAVVVNALV